MSAVPWQSHAGHAMLAHAGQQCSTSITWSCTHSATGVLQARGFTCGYDDLLLVPHAEAARKGLLARAEEAAVAASARYVGVRLPPGFEEGRTEVRREGGGALVGLTLVRYPNP